MNNPIIYDEQRQPRRLGEQIGSGGQGDVYALAENPNIVVKIFNQEKLQERSKLREKVGVQIRVLEDLIKSPYVTWPQIEVFDSNDQWIGYAMKRAKGIPLSRLAHPMLYLKYFPNIDRKGIVQILLHLLDTVETLHKKEIYLGDINLDNFLADPSTFKVYLIDTDSYQVKNAKTSGSTEPSM
jgi:DNA-binding helix-hairpin-helix protein with protein kinase domain